MEIEFMSAKKRLNTIDISRNQITFATGSELKKWIDYMKSMEVLKSLNVDSNPFCSDYPKVKVIPYIFLKEHIFIYYLGYINKRVAYKNRKNQ